MEMSFADAYKNLNKEQREAVDTLDGPVMVVAGPGTGKTQVLALRIANILNQTDTPANGVLCLTFTRSGMTAMRERLARYMGDRARDVIVSTFHSFASNIVDKHFALLDFDMAPRLLDEAESVLLIDEILNTHDWEYLRPRGDTTTYFHDLKSLMSLLKRERIMPDDFLVMVEQEITTLESDPENISSRGESKGQLKKEITKRIESLSRTKEVVAFYRAYEDKKRAVGTMDYDDVIQYAVELVSNFPDVCADIRENYLYVLVDEHQDSSGVQNAFLKAVWSDVESPNIFVVGDDRQLIYGFGGASLSYFEEFKTMFGRAHLITLVENYRSTKPILTLADELLQSTLTDKALKSNRSETESVALSEYTYPRDEVLGAGLYFRSQIAQGVAPEECALLVPKNRQVKSAMTTLRSMGLPVCGEGSISFFDVPETAMFLRLLAVVADPYDTLALSQSVFDTISGIPPIDAHVFLHYADTRKLELADLVSYGQGGGLFDDQNTVSQWGKKISGYVAKSTQADIPLLIQDIGNDAFVDTSADYEMLVRRVEVVRTMLHVATLWSESHPKGILKEFLLYIDRLQSYGHTIPLALVNGTRGITVSTLHSSKGLEYDVVWIAHMNESVMMASKRMGFTLPDVVSARMESRDVEVVRREIYVALTRARVSCTISYAHMGYDGRTLELARVIAGLAETHFIKKTYDVTEQELLKETPKIYTDNAKADEIENTRDALLQSVKDQYSDAKVSVTLLNNFFECPWKWYFRNLLKLPEIKSESLQFGSVIHKILETTIKTRTIPTEQKLHTMLDELLLSEGVHDVSARKRLVKDGMTVIATWVTEHLPRLASDVVTERSVSYRDPDFKHLQMYGKIDLTERFPDGHIMVTDFKTGTPKTTGVIEKEDDDGRMSSYLRQLAMYSYLILGAERGTEVSVSRLLFLEGERGDKNSVYSTHIGSEHIDLLKRDITDYDRSLQDSTWIDRPCSARLYGGEVCEYCARAKQIFG